MKKSDVVVIGGGPAGSTVATLLKMRGWDVTLFEKDFHPRFHIGESLLPMNVPILERLGVLSAVERIGVPKLGADFTIGNSGREHRTFYFREALGSSPDHSFEVRRSEFDGTLFDHCRSSGVAAFQGTRVTRVDPLPDGNHRVSTVDEEHGEQAWEARFVIDASGRDAFLSSSNKWKTRSTKHASAAIFGHFAGVTRRPGMDQGNISLYWFDKGWVWMIPLPDGIMSVGAVCVPEYLRTRRGSLDDFLLATLNSISEVRERIRAARLVMPAQATGNYSYSSRRMCGPGFVIVGDAYAFIDPVFSSGVYLAMNSAERAVRVAEAWLGGGSLGYRRACRRFEGDIRRGLATFSWFIYRFTSPAMSKLMGNPRNTLQVMQAVISMLAGDVFSDRRIRLRLWLFKAIYATSLVLNWRESLDARRRKAVSLKVAEQAGEPEP